MKTALLATVIVLVAGAALADDVGIARARLFEESPGAYLVEVDTTPMLAPGFQAPVLPDRFDSAGRPEFVRVGGAVQIRWRYSAEGESLQMGERILLPWPRTGIDLTARWADGEFHRGFFARGPSGIAVPVASLREIDISRPDWVIHQFGVGARYALSALGVWLLAASLAFARGRHALVDFRWLAGGLALGLAAIDLGLPRPPVEVAVLLPAVAAIILARSTFAIGLPGPGPMLLVLGALLGAGYANLVHQDVPAASLGFMLGLLVVCCAQICLFMAIVPRVSTRWAAGGVGTAAVAVLLAGLLSGMGGTVGLRDANPAPLDTYALPEVQSVSAGGRVAAPRRLETSLAAFLTVEPYEVRLEYLVRAADLVGLGDPIESAQQAELIERLLPVFAAGTAVTIDGRKVEPGLARGDFVTVSANGVLTRPEPVAEPLAEAVIGLTWVFDTGGLPGEVGLAFDLFAAILPEVPLTVTDPLGARAVTLTAEAPSTKWKNRLTGFEIETIDPVPVIPPKAPVIPFVLVAVAVVVGWRIKRDSYVVTALLIVATLAWPFVRLPLAGPLTAVWKLSGEEAVVVLDELLTNVYRSFDMREEGAVYDRLAATVAGEQLTEVFLQSRRSLEMENRGGARGRVDAVEILDIDDIRGADGGGLAVTVTWQVSGSVSHFGHIHYRQNRNRAEVVLEPVEGIWKITGMTILGEERIL